MHTSPQEQTETEVWAGATLERVFQAQGPERGSLSSEVLARIEAAEPTESLRALTRVARTFQVDATGDLEEAARLGKQAIDGLGEEYAEWRARMTFELATNAGRRGRLDEAEALLTEGLADVRARGFTRLEGNFLTGFVLLHSMRGESARSLEVALEAGHLYRRIDQPRGESVVLIAAAHVYSAMGAYPEAMGAFTQALRAAQRAPRVDPSVVATIKAGLAGTFARLSMLEEAERLAREAIQLEGVAPQSEFPAWGALATALAEKGELEAAREAAKRALELAHEIGEDLIIVETLLKLGDVERRAERWEQAAGHYDDGLSIAEAKGMSLMSYQLRLRVGRARVLEHASEMEAARCEAEPLLESLATHEDNHLLIEVHELLSRIAEVEDDPRAAFGHLKEATRIKQRIARGESEARVQSIRAAHRLQQESELAVDRSRELSRLVIESQEEERKRVASELHDGLGQRLALLAVEIDLLSQVPPASQDETAKALASLGDGARSIADQVHLISHQLHPAPLARLGFERATRSICDEVERVHGITARFEAIGIPEHLPDDISLCLYRVTQEALNNAIRHGKANTVHVRAVKDDDEMRLRVTDDGAGFDQEQERGEGIGLPGMAERARALGGTCEVVSQLEQGTRVTVRIPTPAAS